jgi:hypothetical protein
MASSELACALSQRGTGRGRWRRVCFVGTNLSNSGFVDGFMELLSRHGNGSRRFISELYSQLAARRRDGQVLISQLPHQVEGLAHRLLQRHPQRVRFDVRLDRRLHLRRRAEEAICGHQPFDALVRPLEVVAVHEEFEALQQVRVVGEHGAGEEFVPQRLPETLDLAECLRVVRAALDVPDALPLELGLELRLAAPGRVLTAVVGERLLRDAEGGDALLEGLHHQRRLHVVRDGPADDEAAVVVHEDGDVEPLMLAQQEGKDVRLPQLVRRRALEARLRPRRVLYLRGLLLEQTLLVKNPPHRRR